MCLFGLGFETLSKSLGSKIFMLVLWTCDETNAIKVNAVGV